MPEMTKDERKAYEWALNQTYPSVAAMHAETLAKYIQRCSTSNEVPTAVQKKSFTTLDAIASSRCKVSIGMRTP